MNRNDFLNLMESSVPSDRQILSEVNELITIFPWFQSAHLLLLKGLNSNNDIKFGSQLRNSAIYIADREVLYNLLQSVQEKILPEPEKPLMQEDPLETEQTVLDNAMNSEELINEIEKETSEEPEAYNNGIETAETAGIMILSEDESTDEISNKVSDVKVQEDHGIDSLLELDQENSSVENSGISENTFQEVSGDARKIQFDLIDKFIIANPRIVPDREKKDLPVVDRSEPANEEGVFVTETLAKIYIAQGYYSRAIDIFEKLSLKFPEKSSYFATQIEKVKEYLKK